MLDAERIERLQNLLGNKDARIRELEERLEDCKAGWTVQRDDKEAWRSEIEKARTRADAAEQRNTELEGRNLGLCEEMERIAGAVSYQLCEFAREERRSLAEQRQTKGDQHG